MDEFILRVCGSLYASFVQNSRPEHQSRGLVDKGATLGSPVENPKNK